MHSLMSRLRSDISASHRGREQEVPSLVLKALHETQLALDRALALEAVQVGVLTYEDMLFTCPDTVCCAPAVEGRSASKCPAQIHS